MLGCAAQTRHNCACTCACTCVLLVDLAGQQRMADKVAVLTSPGLSFVPDKLCQQSECYPPVNQGECRSKDRSTQSCFASRLGQLRALPPAWVNSELLCLLLGSTQSCFAFCLGQVRAALPPAWVNSELCLLLGPKLSQYLRVPALLSSPGACHHRVCMSVRPSLIPVARHAALRVWEVAGTPTCKGCSVYSLLPWRLLLVSGMHPSGRPLCLPSRAVHARTSGACPHERCMPS